MMDNDKENKVECYIRAGPKTAAGGLVYRTLAQAKSAWLRQPPCMWKITSDKDGSNPTIEVIKENE